MSEFPLITSLLPHSATLLYIPHTSLFNCRTGSPELNVRCHQRSGNIIIIKHQTWPDKYNRNSQHQHQLELTDYDW